MPESTRSLTPIEAESHRPTLPRSAPAAVRAPAAAAARARVTVLGLVVLTALLAMGNVTWWLRQRPAPTRPARATAPAAAPAALPSTTLTPEAPEPPEPTAAPTLSAPVVSLAKTAAPASKPVSAPRPKPTASGPRPLFDFPK